MNAPINNDCKVSKFLCLFFQDFRDTEPDPWSVILPPPITGFLKKCYHLKYTDKHKNKQLASTHHQHSIDRGTANTQVTHANQNLYLKSRESEQFYNERDARNYDKLNKQVSKKGAGLNGGNTTHLSQSNTTLNTGTNREGQSKDVNSISSHVSTLTRSKSENLIETTYYQGRQQMTDHDTDDFSDISSNGSDIGENYEGDQSDVETDEEDQKNSQGENCVIL